jgi:hypothetical protein
MLVRTISPALCGLALGLGCASIAGLDGDYVVGEPASNETTSAGVGGGGTETTTAGGASSGGTASSGADTGTAVGGAGGTGGTPDEVAMISSLDGLRVEHECMDGGAPYCTTSGVVTDMAMGAGDPLAAYDVDVRVRGVLEMNDYQNGSAMGQLYVGGQPSGGWNIYRIDVSDPPAHYYVNNGNCCNAWCEEIDIQTTLTLNGNATLTLAGDDLNNLSTHNEDQMGNPMVVTGVPPAPNPFDGQFVQVSVLDARRQ